MRIASDVELGQENLHQGHHLLPAATGWRPGTDCTIRRPQEAWHRHFTTYHTQGERCQWHQWWSERVRTQIATIPLLSHGNGQPDRGTS